MLNSCHFIGNLGADPKIATTQSGKKVANLSLGVSERWKDRDSGERHERTTWVPVVIWGPLADVAERYLRKGSKVFVCGKFTVRKYQAQDGSDRYATDVVLQGPQAQLVMLDSPGDDRGERKRGYDEPASREEMRREIDNAGSYADDDIPGW